MKLSPRIKYQVLAVRIDKPKEKILGNILRLVVVLIGKF